MTRRSSPFSNKWVAYEWRKVCGEVVSGNPDSFTYDPLNPVKSYGGNVCCTGNAVQGGAFDQRIMETRNDILVFDRSGSK